MKGKKTGGRQKGSVNKRSLQVIEIAERSHIDPFDILLKMAAGDWKGLGYDNECYFMEKPDGAVKLGYTISPEMRLSAAKEASQYLYCKRKEATDESLDVTPQTLEEKKQFLLDARKEIQKLEEEIASEDMGEIPEAQ